MGRIARAVLEGVPHHITQRGNAKQTVFDHPESHRLYLDLLQEYATRFRMSIWAYCLMNNHIHLIAVPEYADSLARALGRTHADFARYVNLTRRTSGHVWQSRYYSCILGDQHLWNAMAYVERNPVRAHLTLKAADYVWSSARVHTAHHPTPGMLDLDPWKQSFNAKTWSEILALPSNDQAFQKRLQEATRTGRPFCDPATTATFEQRLGRTLQAKREAAHINLSPPQTSPALSLLT